MGGICWYLIDNSTIMHLQEPFQGSNKNRLAEITTKGLADSFIMRVLFIQVCLPVQNWHSAVVILYTWNFVLVWHYSSSGWHGIGALMSPWMYAEMVRVSNAYDTWWSDRSPPFELNTCEHKEGGCGKHGTVKNSKAIPPVGLISFAFEPMEISTLKGWSHSDFKYIGV